MSRGADAIRELGGTPIDLRSGQEVRPRGEELEQHAEQYVRTGAHYLRRCPAHDSYEPCPTCHAYIAAGL